MEVRTKTFCSFFVLATALYTAGCAYNQQSRFQMSFLPRAPHSESAEDNIRPPVISVNPYLEKVPPALLAEPLPPKRKTHGDTLVRDAEQALQRGRKAY